ncbi:elongation factor P [Candidatus Berkelbacteria bacterium]|nr:elongation factor P [Candidatus Berkelbacteria bacterium]
MLSISNLKVGTFFELDGTPHCVLATEHSKMGRGGAVLRTKVRNLTTGAVYDRTFQGSDTFPEADVTRRKGQFLYADSQGATFMESETFEQYTLTNDRLGTDRQYLKEGLPVDLILYNDSVLGVAIPAKVDLAVTYTEPGFKGDTQSTVTKPAELETGLTVNVPLFVKTGDTVRVSTQTGQYVERVSSEY